MSSIKKINSSIKAQKTKGQTLYLTMILLAIFSAIILGVTTIITSGAKITKGLGDSVKAFHAADTGIEQALYNTRSTSPNCAEIHGNFGDANYKWDVIITYTTCGATGTTIQSSGTYYGTSRKIEVSY